MLTDVLRRQKNWLGISALAMLPLIIWLHVLTPQSKTLDVTVLDVGQGDSILIRTPSGKTMLIDGGGRPGPSDVDPIGPRVVEPFLRRQGINRLDVMVLTHPHDDHLGGLCSVIQDFRVGMVIDPAIPCSTQAYQRFLSTIRSRRIPYHRANRGQVIDFGDGTKAALLNPPALRLAGTSDDTNNNSVVLRMTFGRSAIMLTSDVGIEAEEDMLNTRMVIRSDVLKVGHHGSDSSSGDAWLDAVHPHTALISVGRSNSFGHPSPEVLRRLSDRGIRILRTDKRGAVSIRFTESKFTATCAVPAKKRM